MGIGISVFIMAIGAVLTWGINVQNSHGFDINTIGVILMGVGAIGLIVALVIFGGRRRGGVVVEDRTLV